MKNRFFKGHGLGNEYIVLDPAELTFKLTPERITWICDRRKGIGSDGVLTLQDSDSADFGLRIWNPDGSEAETSGNGLRIFACYLRATGRTQKQSFSVETPGGKVQVETQIDPCGVVSAATVQMGRATFSPAALPCTLDIEELVEQPIKVTGETLTFTGVSVGNPHCVVFHPRSQRWQPEPDDLLWRRVDLLRIGPALETHPIFPNRTNVQLAETTGLDSIHIHIWERGAGETQSSGSSACAAASAAVRQGMVTPPVTVESPGGAMLVDIDEEFNLKLTGPVAEVARGTLSSTLLRQIEALD